MAKEQDSTKPEDFSGEIASELEQLIALSELLREMPDPDDVRENFFSGLGGMIGGASDRLKSMLEPTYKKVYGNGRSHLVYQMREKAAGQVFLALSQSWINEMRVLWQEEIKKIKEHREPQEITDFINSIEAFGASFWFTFDKKAPLTIDDLIPGDGPASS